jgi:hypothetical protein
MEIVSEQAAVLVNLAAGFLVADFGQANLTGSCGETNLYGLLIVLQDEMPLAPS